MIDIDKKASGVADQAISQAERWERRFRELIQFKNLYGHCNVPVRWKRNPNLGRWVDHQRKLYLQGKLSDERMRKLKNLGFHFHIRDTKWEQMFSALLRFKEKHGDCNVPDRWPESFNLGHWVKYQRNSMKQGTLGKDHFKRLQKIGFIWRRHENSWEKMFTRLIRFKDKNGHCNVPRKYSADGQLARWVYTQRYRRKKGLLKTERIKWLNEIGFEWKMK